MARPELPDLTHLALPGQVIEVQVRPGARRSGVELVEGALRVQTTAAPEDGKANREVARMLAKALGIAPSRLELVRGATSRSKQFRVQD